MRICFTSVVVPSELRCCSAAIPRPESFPLQARNAPHTCLPAWPPSPQFQASPGPSSVSRRNPGRRPESKVTAGLLAVELGYVQFSPESDASNCVALPERRGRRTSCTRPADHPRQARSRRSHPWRCVWILRELASAEPEPDQGHLASTGGEEEPYFAPRALNSPPGS